MGAHNDPKVDPHTGISTTGHEWDGIAELNTPLPRWWLIIFYLCVAWAFGYWIFYPSWPTLNGYLPGIWHWSSRGALDESMSDLTKERATWNNQLASTPITDVMKAPQLKDFALKEGGAAFAQNCSPCHGAGGQGNKGYPNLTDDDWLWGGTLADIQTSITHGIRYDADHGVSKADADPETRASAMPAFGRDGLLKPDEINLVANYVLSLSGLPVEANSEVVKAKQLFTDNCAVCHGEDGKGQQAMGAPNLTDKIWLYSKEKPIIVYRITNGGGAAMPAWGKKLDQGTINALTMYVHSLGGGQ